MNFFKLYIYNKIYNKYSQFPYNFNTLLIPYTISI